jgi:peptidoglycan/xylan/chitin deacetylase (PgdA/CDA1 family)
MKKIFYKIFGHFANFLPTSFVSKLSNINIICPFYHVVEPYYADFYKNLYKPLTLERWLKDIDFLIDNYKPLSPEEFHYFVINNLKPKKKSFFLTFDDGLREIYDIVFPVLSSKGIKPAVFVNTDYIDNKDLFYRYSVSLIIEKIKQQPSLEKLVLSIMNDFTNINGKNVFEKLLNINYSNKEILNKIFPVCDIDIKEILDKYKPYLTWEQIKLLADNGWYIGSHGTNHKNFQLMSEQEAINDLKKSFNEIESHVHQKFRIFAFPFTDYGLNEKFINALFESKATDICLGGAGIYREKCRKHFQRIPMEIEFADSARFIIHSEYLYYFAKRILNKSMIKR